MRTPKVGDLSTDDLASKARQVREKARRAQDPMARTVLEEVARGYELLASSPGIVEENALPLGLRNLVP
jgi:hypothetical protein